MTMTVQVSTSYTMGSQPTNLKLQLAAHYCVVGSTVQPRPKVDVLTDSPAHDRHTLSCAIRLYQECIYLPPKGHEHYMQDVMASCPM